MVGNTTVNHTLVYGAMSMQHSEIDTGLLLVGLLNMTITGRDVYGNLVTGEERAFAVNEIEVRPTAAAEPSAPVSGNDD